MSSPAPWRKVVEATRLPTNGRRMVVTNRLECGHVLRFVGEAALDARFAERRRCKECVRRAFQEAASERFWKGGTR